MEPRSFGHLFRSGDFRSAIWVLCLVTLVACSAAAGNPTPAALTPETASPVVALATATETLLPPRPVPTLAGPIVSLRSVALGTYIYDANGQAQVGKTDRADPGAQWVIEDYQGSKRIRNQATGNYLSIEHLLDYVEVIPIYPVWMSPRWTFETDPASGALVICNVWHNWQVLYVDSSTNTLKYGRPPTQAQAAQWTIETTAGTSLPTQTPTSLAVIPTSSNPVGSRGAAVPWVEYEAEAGKYAGTLLGPDRTFGTFASEASGREAVQVNATGEYVQFTTKKSANSIVVRYVIPDSQDGNGLSATISLYVNGSFRQKLNLTSKYAWSYGGEAAAYNVPAIGGAHHFFDETRALVKEIPAGASVMLRKDKDDGADYYVIDLVDLELVEPPKTMPNGALSIVTDCGAVPDDGLDDGPAIQKCFDLASARGKAVWIPVGTFESTTLPFEVSNVTIQGAGMWYSTIHGFYARFNCTGSNCRYADFAVLGETTNRVDSSPENGFNGAAGSGSRLDHIWVEHTKVGYWVGPGATNGLVINGCRFRDLFADGVNFSGGTIASVVENSHFRNTGDDSLASWSQAGMGGNIGNLFRFDTVQVPWRANCYAIYGGQDNAIEDSLCYDVVEYPGILIAQSFNSTSFAGTTRVERNSLIRAGGSMYHQEWGALKIWPQQGAINNIFVKDIVIEAPTFSGLEIDGSYALLSASFADMQIVNAGTNGILIHSSANGEVLFTRVVITNPAQAALLNYGPKLYFHLNKGVGNQGW